ncbi:MAG: S-adenosylmethionine:tRNA ribosyltransferase-isomerase [Paramuribaculum sp.]|nr:S-adenosylmethionine:tRNA ribosyltransferase-isomerase [Paramuribaculum sp.]
MQTKDIAIGDYYYDLPEDRIALHPVENRSSCKLLVRTPDGVVIDSTFEKIGDFLYKNSCLIVNNTKVVKARLRFRKNGTGAQIEIFCLEPWEPRDYEQNFASKGECEWVCLVGNSKKWKSGTINLTVAIQDGKEIVLTAERLMKKGDQSIVKFRWNGDLSFSEILTEAGEIPIPPYLNRSSEESDNDDYQTVYSRINGSVAAPTAGLHFTEELFDRLNQQGIEKKEVTLHVGAGTFQPVKSEKIGEHAMHVEFISVDKNVLEALKNHKEKIIAVGTTSVRTLESLYHLGCKVLKGEVPDKLSQWEVYEDRIGAPTREESLCALSDYMETNGLEALSAETQIMIAPGYKFRMIDGMITNFHQPKSTLLLLLSAFIGEDWRSLYKHALDSDYRFLSYGDAMLLLK